MNKTDGVELSDLDEYDHTVIAKIEHSANCGACRRLFSTLSFQSKLLKQDAFIGLVAEWLKTLASSFCRSKSYNFDKKRLSVILKINYYVMT